MNHRECRNADPAAKIATQRKLTKRDQNPPRNISKVVDDMEDDSMLRRLMALKAVFYVPFDSALCGQNRFLTEKSLFFIYIVTLVFMCCLCNVCWL